MWTHGSHYTATQAVAADARVHGIEWIRYEPVLSPGALCAAVLEVNLIVNAAHAIPERGTIALATRAEGDWVCVEVADTGTGMTEEVKRRIFEPFFTTKPVGKGTGLGLSLSFSIVQKHGGRIEVDSEPGVGTQFRVWIPVRADPP